MQAVDHIKANWKAVASLMAALIFVLTLNGALPFLAIPTLGQAVWTTGFSQSFVNDSIFSIHAKNFGIPEPAAIAFGLAGAYPAGLFIAAGLHPADAYAAMAALWLALALFGAWRIGLMFGLNAPFATLGAALWMSTPMIWAHSGYSMLSLGIGLLAFYFWTALNIFTRQMANIKDAICSAALFVVACLIAVFMDGYSFMMFAVGSALLAVYIFLRFAELRRQLLVFALPLYTAGFALAYGLYVAYIGNPDLTKEPLDFFRGWGVDLSFLSVPSQGTHWIFDALSLSVPRSSQEYFGDVSVWVTTFSLPLITFGFFAWLYMYRRSRLAIGFLVMALFGLYMSMGPSIKFYSVKSKEMKSSAQIVRLMPAQLAVAPTGNAWLSRKVPGFKNMRASYRWLALGAIGFWLLVMLLFADAEARGKRFWLWSITVLIIVLNLPHPLEKIKDSIAYRKIFLEIDHDLVNDFRGSLKVGEKVVFLPYGNDMLINYLASRTNIRAFNIGGDKNLFAARKHWPQTMRTFEMGEVDANFADRVRKVLIRDEADVVVLPYFDSLWGAHLWPCEAELKVDCSEGVRQYFREYSCKCPFQLKDQLSDTVKEFKKDRNFRVTERSFYTVVRLAR